MDARDLFNHLEEEDGRWTWGKTWYVTYNIGSRIFTPKFTDGFILYFTIISAFMDCD